MRRKYNAPVASSATATPADTHNIRPGGGVPSKAQRNPSTPPTIGFSAYTVRQGSLSKLLGYATGVAKSQNWLKNGTTKRTSRYSTLSAESQRPTPRAVTM